MLRARAPPRLLDARSRAIVERVASDVCECRAWQLFAVNARTNHVQLVVAAACVSEDVALSLKSWITRRRPRAGELPANTPIWSRHASTGCLWTTRSRDRAVHYTMYHQDVEPDAIGRPAPDRSLTVAVLNRRREPPG